MIKMKEKGKVCLHLKLEKLAYKSRSQRDGSKCTLVYPVGAHDILVNLGLLSLPRPLTPHDSHEKEMV